LFTYLFTFYLVIYLFIFTLTFKCLTGQWHVLIQDRKGYDYEQVVIDIIFSVALTFGLEQSIFPFKFLLNLCILYQKVSVKIPCKYTKMKLIFGLAPKILFFPNLFALWEENVGTHLVRTLFASNSITWEINK